jgi:hypothetical protein
MLRRMRATGVDMAGLQSLVASIERWSILRGAMDIHIARQNQDHAAEDEHMARLSQLLGLGGNEWAAPIFADLSRQPVAPAGVPTPAAIPAAPFLAIAGLDRSLAVTGNWSPDKLGARCIGGGDLRITKLDSTAGVELEFTPIAYQGGLRLTLRQLSIGIDFGRSMLDIKVAQSPVVSIPVAIFPRNRNSLSIRFGDQREPLQLRINHDQSFPVIDGIRGLSEMTLSLSAGSDIRLHALAFK